MSTDDFFGPPIRALGELRAIRPDEAWERRVQARCLAEYIRERRPAGILSSRLVDAALVAAVGLYVMSIVTAALALAAVG